MAIVLIDNEAFKTTLQIVEDFISGDYDAFIENGPTDDIKLITWEMEIYFKKLEGKENSIVKYYMIPIYKLLKLRFYGYYQDCKTKEIYERFNSTYTLIDAKEKKYLLNTLTFDFEKNILTKTITIKIIVMKNLILNFLIEKVNVQNIIICLQQENLQELNYHKTLSCIRLYMH